MVQPIKTHPIDTTEDEVRDRHASIEQRLEEMGPDHVRMALLSGGLPTEWNPIIHKWLAGDKLQPKPKSDPEEGGTASV